MTPRRLLIVTDCGHGGTYHVATLLAEGLRDAFAIALAAPFGAEGSPPGTETHAIALSYENLDRSSYAVDTAAALLDAARPDLILFVDGAELSSLLAVKQVARRRGVPYVIVVNLLSADVLERFAPYMALSRETLAAAAAVVFVSEASRARGVALLPDLAFPSLAIPNSVPDAFFAPRDPALRAATRAALGVGDDELMILTAARIEERKGQALGVAALGRLASPTAWRWRLAGRAEAWDRQKLEAAIAEAGVADRVEILGERDDMLALLDASDLFVLTSYAEGMPLCIIEAMAKGVPVIATAIDGIVEQVDDSCGVLLPDPGGQGSAENEAACVAALTAALARLGADRVGLVRMGAAARARATALFHRTICLARYRSLLESIPSGAPTHAEPAATLGPGDSLDFSDVRKIWNHLEDGWARCERGGIWTDGTVSTLRLRLKPDAGRLRLRFDVTPFDRRRDRTTRVYADDSLVGRWKARPGRNWLSIEIEPTGRDILLRFENPGAVRPCDIGLGDDWRQLALFVRRVEIDPAPPPSAFARLRALIAGGR